MKNMCYGEKQRIQNITKNLGLSHPGWVHVKANMVFKKATFLKSNPKKICIEKRIK